MHVPHRLLVSVSVGVWFGSLGVAAVAAQVPVSAPASGLTTAAVVTGEIVGAVTDVAGEPLSGALVSVFGPSGAELARSNRDGGFSLLSLIPGSYLVQVHRTGYAASRRELVQVAPGPPVVLPVTLSQASKVSAALLAGAALPTRAIGVRDEAEDEADTEDVVGTTAPHDHSERAWRLRRARRSVLKDVSASGFLGDTDNAGHMAMARNLGPTPLERIPLRAEVNLLTRSSFESPSLFDVGQPRPAGIANLSVGAPVWGGDWSAQGAMTTGDVSSWVVAGEWIADSDTPHQLGLDVSYGRQQYYGGNPAALTVASESRYAASFGVSDRWTLSPTLTAELGARYATYGYLQERGLFSPRAALDYEFTQGIRLRIAGSREVTAPGAEEFLPPVDSELWLPPERTFAALSPEYGLHAQVTRHFDIGIEGDVTDGYVVGVRRFYQDVTDQMATLFGVDELGVAPTGHYYLARAGGVMSRGWILSVRREFGDRINGSIDYAMADAFWAQSSVDTELGLAVPGAIRPPTEWFHDLSATVQAVIPETSTSIYVRCRVSGGFVPTEPGDADGMEPRFDIRVRQELPFSPLDTGRWEALVAVRSLFFGPQSAASMFDELLVTRPPKQVVGGLVVHF
ncbi:MAG: hypothetical protein CL483_10310 [Acidobacteria bacterium]|nr:hypothetical protein [Acidobacteriota bacterium]